ncbi:hypothetical protein RCO48_15550 [Peribacillus frigoritolerans]|nr:hypothetical protein [Peribacillus frigoritolerans]
MLDTILGMVTGSVTKSKVVTTSLTVHYLASISSGELFAEAKSPAKRVQNCLY